MASAERALEKLMKKYAQHLLQNEFIPFQLPTLTNNILPMFTDRWATGRDQSIQHYFQRLRPALQLASRFLTEDYCLLWFSQLTFGERRRKSPHSSDRYIIPTAYASSPEAIAQVKENLRKLGKVITLMIAPLSCRDNSWGITYHGPSDLPFLHEFREADFPPTQSRSGFARPVITMNRGFDTFFLTVTDVSFQEYSRALFVFATTLVHEVAHAYNFWLGYEDEPLWNYNEKSAELGFSWESNVLGRIMDPLASATYGKSRFRFLCSSRFESCATPAQRVDLFRELKGSHSATFTTLDRHGQKREYPLLRPRDVRGGRLYTRDDTPHTVAAIHHIPCQWIVNWLQEDWWVRMKMEWARQRAYRPPALGDAFMLIYENNVYSAQVHRPLNPASEVDANILQDLASARFGGRRMLGQY